MLLFQPETAVWRQGEPWWHPVPVWSSPVHSSVPLSVKHMERSVLFLLHSSTRHFVLAYVLTIDTKESKPSLNWALYLGIHSFFVTS